MSAVAGGARFSWMLEKTNRRRNLADARDAVAGGRLDAGERCEMAEVLGVLRRDEGLTARELARLDQVVAAIAEADRIDPELRPIRLHRAESLPNPF